MSQTNISSAAYSDSKPHYEILNGLRGVAALTVIWYHVFEAFATSPYDQKFNHGYLAVDFFFILSGFVIGYAYDDRWKKMKTKDFFKRRLIRLHPMVVMGAVLGAITFYLQGSVQWDGTKIGTSALMLALLFTMFLIPAAPGSTAEVRGNGEMYPLNGPSWSLFFEYIGNILYALFIRKMSTKALTVLVAFSGTGLAWYAIFSLSGYGHLGVGWSMLDNNLLGGILRLLFSFSAGLLLSRIFKPRNIKGAFLICSLVIIALLSMPYIGGEGKEWMNGLYDAVCVILIFPALVYLGASGKTTSNFSSKICKFLGDISYPVYIIHYPFMYLFYAWVWGSGIFAREATEEGITFAQSWPIALLIFFGNILLAYIILKVYDEPVRKFLTRRFLLKQK